VAVALCQVMADEASEASKLCEMMNKFFDCLNVRSLTEHKTRNKPDVKPYVNDERLDWLQTDFFLSYLSTWKNNNQQKGNKFTATAKAKMFISWQTFEGFITSYSTIGVVHLLLREGFDYVLMERFCQDVLEEYFGYQRGMGRRADNPSLKEFRYDANAIAIQGQLAPIIKGNVVGRHHQGRRRQHAGVMAEPLNARKSRAKRGRFNNSQ